MYTHWTLYSEQVVSSLAENSGQAARSFGLSPVVLLQWIRSKRLLLMNTSLYIPWKVKTESPKGQGSIHGLPYQAGDPGYSPLWHHNYVTVPRDYEPQTLRSKEDVIRSGYEIVATDKITD